MDTAASKPNNAAKANYLSALIAAFLYFGFLTVLGWYVAFLVPSSHLPMFLSFVTDLDKAPRLPAWSAITLDLLLIAWFGMFHSFFARRPVKKWMNLPRHYERSFFVMQTELCLILLLTSYRNFDGPTIWDATASTLISNSMVALQMFGAAFLVTATFALDHFELFGLSQGFGIDFNQMVGLAPAHKAKTVVENKTTPLLPESDALVVPVIVSRWHYKLMAHPIMTGFLIIIWSTPLMTAPRFVFSIGYTIYILAAVHHFEEPDLLSEFGETYAQYLGFVPRFRPSLT